MLNLLEFEKLSKQGYVMIDLDKLSTKELLNLNSAIIDTLKKRNILRTNNNPVGDFAGSCFNRQKVGN